MATFKPEIKKVFGIRVPLLTLSSALYWQTAGNVAETGASPKLAKAIPSLFEGEKEAPSTESSLKLVLEDEEEEDESEKSEQKMRILIDKVSAWCLYNKDIY